MCRARVVADLAATADALLAAFAGSTLTADITDITDSPFAAVAVTGDAGTELRRCPAEAPADALFEIGSITKTMTATLLASLVVDGRLGLDDPIGRRLDAGDQADVTLLELATHRSGLPRLAPTHRHRGWDRANPYAAFTAEHAEAGLRAARRGPRTYAYSNFGYQLLALFLERVTGTSFGELLAARVLCPAGITAAGVGAAAEGSRIPCYAAGRRVARWDTPLAGFSGVEAGIADLARYAAALLRPPTRAFGEAVALATAPLLRLDDRRAIALAWTVLDDRLLIHSGETGGFSSALAIDRERGRAAAVVANSAGYADALQAGALLAVTGGDPGLARPGPLGSGWADLAAATTRDFLAGRLAEVHARMVPDARLRQPLARLETLLAATVPGTGAAGKAGEAGELRVSCRRVSGGIGTEVTAGSTRSPVRLALLFDRREGLTYLGALRPDEALPW